MCAAWHLARSGVEVILVEKKKVLGGRAGSVADKHTGQVIEPVHIFLGIYESALRWFSDLGTRDKIVFEPSLGVRTFLPGGGRVGFRAARMAPPLDFLLGLWPLCTGFGEKLRLLRLARIMGPLSGLDKISVAMWLDRMNVPEAVRKYALEPLATSYLNQPTSQASAYPFAALLRRLVLRGSVSTAFGISRASLDDLYVRPAADFIAVNGGRIIRGVAVTGLLVSGGGIVTGVALGNGAVLEGDAVISSAMPWDLARITSGYAGLDRFTSGLNEFKASPMVTVHLWLDRPVVRELFANIASPAFDWVFNSSGIREEPEARGQRLCLMRTAATGLRDKKEGELLALACDEVESFTGGMAGAKVLHGRVDWDMNGTVALEPGTQAMRPKVAGPIPGLIVAGDWVRTGLPTTFESAVLSGIMAAKRALSAGPGWRG